MGTLMIIHWNWRDIQISYLRRLYIPWNIPIINGYIPIINGYIPIINGYIPIN